MAKAIPFLFLVAGLLILSTILLNAQVPDVPEPTCVGGFTASGAYIPKEQGGCCKGLECCQYEAFKNNPGCGASASSCSGLDCCQYDEYKNTPLCVVSPTPTDDSCTAPPPECQLGSGYGASPPMLLDPDIASKSKCRGACGPDCPRTCIDVNDQTHCISDGKGECVYVCTYSNVLSCGTHVACQTHDDCYDTCAANGEVGMGFPSFGLCHRSCDIGCFATYGFSCLQWMNGNGPVDSHVLYSSPPLRSGPFRSCPAGSIPS
jgi:hypothetical protein